MRKAVSEILVVPLEERIVVMTSGVADWLILVLGKFRCVGEAGIKGERENTESRRQESKGNIIFGTSRIGRYFGRSYLRQ